MITDNNNAHIIYVLLYHVNNTYLILPWLYFTLFVIMIIDITLNNFSIVVCTKDNIRTNTSEFRCFLI